MTIDKKIAARKAAAKYSTDPNSATVEYAKLSGQSFLSNTDYTRLRDEMLSMLPPYRHPVNGELIEYMIFFNPDCVDITGLGYEQPAFVEALKKEGVAENLLTAAKNYVRESERRIIELAQCKDELGELKTKFSEARRVYEKFRSERSDKKNASVARVIGLSTGSAPKRVNGKKVYFDYVNLIRKEGLSRDDAVEKIRKKYDIFSYNAVVKTLSVYRTILLDFWKQNYPSTTLEIIKYLRKLIPSKKE